MKDLFSSRFVVGFAIFSLAGCAVGPNYQAPQDPIPAQFQSAAAGTSATATDDTSLQTWWARFNNEQLNQLVGLAITNNRDVRAAIASIRAARAEHRVTYYDFAPIVTAQGAYNRVRTTQGSVPPGGARNYDVYDTGFDATWELDVFGRVRRNVEATRADLASVEAVRDDLLVSVTAETARAYLELRGLMNELRVARRNAENQKATLELTVKLLEGGRGTDLDVARAQAQFDTTRAGIPQLEGAISRDEHRLAVLTGRVPEGLTQQVAIDSSIAELPSVSLGDPAALLRRRPDIRAAERRLAAATARIGVATADLFPRFTVGGSLGLSASTPGGLGREGAQHFSLGPNISWAFLDSPRRYQLVKAAGARAESQIETYRQTVLLALEDTENALTNYGREKERRDLLANAVKASDRAAALARQRFEQGTANFLEVLDAERVKLQAEAALASSQTQTATDLIALFKSLGGGWKPQESHDR